MNSIRWTRREPNSCPFQNPFSFSAMNNNNRCSSIHKIRDIQLEEVELNDNYDILRLLGEGCYGQVHLALHKDTGSKVALKSVRKDLTKRQEFLREFHYSYYLSPHLNILKSYYVAFQTSSAFVFAQEYAPLGDLEVLIRESGSGLDENKVKVLLKQVASALDFLHSKELVHRDIKPRNILVFEKDASLVKMTDFGLTQRVGTLVKRTNIGLSYMPPEICDTVYNEGYHVEKSSDVWQLAILTYVCLTASMPWEQADIFVPNFREFLMWQKRKTTKVPRQFRAFSSRLQRLFRRMLHPKPSKRAPIKEVFKYLQDKWMSRTSNEKNSNKERDSESSPNSRRSTNTKATLGQLLMGFGVETTIDRETKRQRVHEWIMATSP